MALGVWHITWSVNSLAHASGYQNYDTGDYSRNNVFVAIITSGEGWHNNHHAEPGSACNQRLWWEIDLCYLLLRVLVLFGLAWDVKLPRKSCRIESRATRSNILRYRTKFTLETIG